MELLLIPALLLTGFVFLILSAGGMQSAHIAYGPTQPANSVRSAIKRSWFTHGSRQITRGAAGPIPAPAREDETDVILADLMTEMIEFREQLNVLREEIKALAAANKPAEAPAKPRRSRKSAA